MNGLSVTHREGLRLWLHRCNWGKGAIPEWQQEQIGHRKQMTALLETLQRPSVFGKALYQPRDYMEKRWEGIWLHIQLPRLLSGNELTLQPAMIERYPTPFVNHWGLTDTEERFYDQFLDGSWIDPQQFGKLPFGPEAKIVPADFEYSEHDQHLVWQVWVVSCKAEPVLELEVRYPEGVLKRADGRGYLFRLKLSGDSSEADRLNTAFSGELKEEDDLVLRKTETSKLPLKVPSVGKGA